ncbi:MAG: LysR family transcriptional regulator [Eubacteriaceae bacterium]|jgi:DNA-binding transcriptional LysR family regulator
MTFEQLDCFIAVVENENFYDAAESLHITQSSLSKQIIKLERELDIPLLIRSHRTTTLTEAGKLFYQEALALSRSYHDMLGKMRMCHAQQTKMIRIGTLPILAQYHLDLRLRKFQELHPEIAVKIEEAEETVLINRFEADQYDFIIMREENLHLRNYVTHLLIQDELVCILPVDHPLVKQTLPSKKISLQDLADEAFILMNPYTSIHQLCLKLFQEEKIKPNVIRTARTETIIGAVSGGEGISLLAKSNLKIFNHRNIATVSLDPCVPLPVYIASKKEYRKGTPENMFIEFITS